MSSVVVTGYTTIGGDLIVSVGGKTIRDPSDISAAIADKSPGDTVTIRYYRGSTLHSAQVQLAKRPNTSPNASQQQGGGGGGGGGLPQLPLP